MENRKYFYILFFIALSIFATEVVRTSSIIKYYPLHTFRDASTYLPRMHFLKEYGYEKNVPNWYNGEYVNSGKNYPYGWFIIMIPIYLLTNNINLTAFISIILPLVLCFIIVYNLCRKVFHWNRLKSILFYLVIFASPPALFDFFIEGRLISLFESVMLLIILSFIFYYKSKEFSINETIILALILGISLIIHPATFILSLISLSGLFIIKNWKERALISTSVLTSIAIASYWLIPFIFAKTSSFKVNFSQGVLSIGTIVSIMFILSFCFYMLNKKLKDKETVILAPFVIMSVATATQFLSKVPVLGGIYPNIYRFLLVIIISYMLLNSEPGNKIHIKIHAVLILIMTLFLISGFIAYTPNVGNLEPGNYGIGSIENIKLKDQFSSFKYTEIDLDAINILNKVNQTYLIFFPIESIEQYQKMPQEFMLYSYGSLYLNLSTSSGSTRPFGSPDNIIVRLDEATAAFRGKNCTAISNTIYELKTKQLISYSSGCRFFEECGYNNLHKVNNFCLYEIKYS